MRILGIDPGYDRMGWAVLDCSEAPRVERFGILRVPPEDDFGQRLAVLRFEARALLVKLAPDEVAMETFFVTRALTQAAKVAEARGVIHEVIGSKKLPLGEYSPQQIKKGVTGSGNAKKRDVQKAVLLEFGLNIPRKDDDAADAVAVAYFHWLQTRLTRRAA